jgi:hypothetical protein
MAPTVSAVIIEAHVERLYFLGVVEDNDRLLEMILCQVPLVLGLQVRAKIHRKLKRRGKRF